MQPLEQLTGLNKETKRRALQILREQQRRANDFIRSVYRPLPTPAQFHATKARYAMILGGNRSGKTEANCADLCMRLLDCHPHHDTRRENRYWFATLDWGYLGAVIWGEKLKRMLPERYIQDIAWHNKAREIPEIIWMTNGKRLDLKSYEAGKSKFQAASLDGIYLDEQIPHQGEEIWRECRMRVIDRSGFIRWSFTPVIYQEWLKTLVDTPPREYFIAYANLNDNRKSRGGYIDDYEIDLLIGEWPESVRVTRIEGRFAGFEGMVFKEWQPAVHVVNPRLIPRDWTHGIAIDFGYNNPFCALLYAIDPDGRFWFLAEHFKSHTLLKDHAEVLKAWMRDYPVRHIWADHDAQDRAELEACGIPTKPAKKDVLPGIERVSAALRVKGNGQPGLLVFRETDVNPGMGCPSLIREFASYRWAEKREGLNAKEEPLKLDDHAVDACRYAVYSHGKKTDFIRQSGGLV